MIIGINGKIGSGKDTIGNIIQFLTCMHKMTLADHQAKTLESFILAPRSNEIQSGWEIKKFAGKLKQIGSILTGIPVEMFEDQEFKKQQMPTGWGMTYRTFLQKLGTEGMRVGVHTNVWCNALFSDYKSDCTPKDAFNKNLPNWIITDMRFPNEMEAVEQRKGLTIRVIRPARQLPKGDGVFPTIQEYVLHPSETALDDAKFDYEIINDGSIEDLIEKVREVLTMEKII